MVIDSKNIEMIDSSILAQYILQKYGEMSHLKLQKLVFYCHAYHLAYFDTPLIIDKFEAWVHGPVSRKLFNEIRDLSLLYDDVKYKRVDGEELPSEILTKTLSNDQIELITDVLNEFSSYRGFELENLSHSELPWQKAREGYGMADKCDVIISNSLIKEYYKSQLYA